MISERTTCFCVLRYDWTHHLYAQSHDAPTAPSLVDGEDFARWYYVVCAYTWLCVLRGLIMR